MNKVEILKTEKDGLDVLADLERYAQLGWESIPEDDIQRLKWYGVFLRNPTPGYFMLRIRMPGGRTNALQVQTLAQLSKTYGNGVIDLTTRQQLQLRNLTIQDVPEVFRQMQEVGLCSVQTGMDNVRNILTCPVSGLTAEELCDTRPLVERLNDAMVGHRDFSNLPRKFNMAITGCRHNCLHLETQDLAFIPATLEGSDGIIPGFNVFVGGKLGSGGYRIATPLDVFASAQEVVGLTAAILRVFRDHGCRASRTTARLAFLLEDWGEKTVSLRSTARGGMGIVTGGA